MEYRQTRFAPSPTGYLHMGHVVSALYVWTVAKIFGAKVILRIEDHDKQRSRKKFEEAILKDLEWLGFKADDGVSAIDKKSIYRQSDCEEKYIAAREILSKQNIIYACACSRKVIAEQNQSIDLDLNELYYPRTCRNLGLKFSEETGTRMLIEDKTEKFHDLLLGEQSQIPARQCGDLLIKERHGSWTYHFAVSVDDLNQGMDLIVRGQDLTTATGRQIYLSKKLGRKEQAAFFHHPLLLSLEGKKLSKRHLSEAITKHRLDHSCPETVLKAAASGLGLDLKRDFSWRNVSDSLQSTILKSNKYS